MKLLVCGDIHGNLPALEIMLETEKDNYDQLVCHGDVVNYGPWSNECVELLDTIDSAILLKGNHEENFLNGEYPGEHPIAKAFFNFCYPSFTYFEKIKRYSYEIEFGEFIIKHSINNTYMFLDTPIDTIDRSYIIGHSHQQFERIINQYRLVNTGSVGQNRSMINLISYAIYEVETNKVELKNIKYNHELVINEMISQSYPEICINYYKNKNILK
jgi:predicted phosphodiesterase